MVEQKTYERLLPIARQWALEQEQFVLARGSALAPQAIADAILVGVEDPARVRILVVDRIPLPDHPELAAASRRSNIITEASRGITIGHGIIIRADSWGDRELLLHLFIHVAQCERSGGLESFVEHYLSDRRNCANFTVGALEEEARSTARNLCAGRVPA